MAELPTADRLVLWLWRELHVEQIQPTPGLLAILRLTFGLAGLEPALRCVARLQHLLRLHRRYPPVVLASCAPSISVDEILLLQLLATRQHDLAAHHDAIARRLVRAAGAAVVGRELVRLAALLSEAGQHLALPRLAGGAPERTTLPRPSVASR